MNRADTLTFFTEPRPIHQPVPADQLDALTAAATFEYDPNQPRDDHGRWDSAGGDRGVTPEDWQLAAAPSRTLPWDDFQAAVQKHTDAQNGYAAAHLDAAARTAFQGDTPGAQALRGWTVGDYHQLSPILRGKAGSLDDPATNAAFSTVRDQVTTLDAAIAQGSVTQDMVVFRGSGSWATDLQPGDVVTDKSFVSTSLSKDVARGFGSGTTFQITVRGGSHAVFTNENRYKVLSEAEVLLPRGQSFRVTGRDGDVIRATVE